MFQNKREILNQPLRLESREKWNREKNQIYLKEKEMRVEGLLRLREGNRPWLGEVEIFYYDLR